MMAIILFLLSHAKKCSCCGTLSASGSTSQAAAVIEAVELGSPLLLLDEDTSASNFMIRDSRMRALIAQVPHARA